MTSSSPPRYFRRMIWLGIFIVVLFGGYSAAWFYGAKFIQQKVVEVIEQANSGSAKITCDEPTARGFPFRIGVSCDRFAFADTGMNVTSGTLSTLAQVYNPFFIIGEMTGPATVDIAGKGVAELNWNSMRASVRIDQPLPQRISLEAKKLVVGPAGKAPLVTAADAQAHMRPNGADVDVAYSFDALTLDPSLLDGGTLLPLSGTFDATLTNGVAILTSGDQKLRGKSGVIRDLTLLLNATTGLSVVGPVAVDESGLIDASLRLTLRNPQEIAEALTTLFPQNADQIRKAGVGAALMGSAPELPLVITKGKAVLGFIPLGDIPPVE